MKAECTCKGRGGKGKDLYPSLKMAVSIALKRSRQQGPLRVYRCPEKKGWHLTGKT